MKLFSLTFHRDVFLPFLWQKLKPDNGDYTLVPSVHSSFEHFLFPTLALAILITGLLNLHHTIGTIAVVLGAFGLSAMLIQSIFSLRGTGFKPTLDDFYLGIFLFFIILGILTGLIIGLHHSNWFKFGEAVLGLTVGYFVGILAGMWGQYLGWMGVIIEYMCWLASMGMIIPVILLALPS